MTERPYCAPACFLAAFMASRLGNVIYWTAFGLALLWAAGAIVETASSHQWIHGSSLAIAGATVIWGIGRAAKYVLGEE
jgi:hypothetical protein